MTNMCKVHCALVYKQTGGSEHGHDSGQGVRSSLLVVSGSENKIKFQKEYISI